MRAWKECINLVSLRIEPDGMRPGLGLDRFDKPHPLRIENIDHAGVTYCDVETTESGIKEDDIGRTVQLQVVRHLAGRNVQANQSLRIAGTEQSLGFHVEIQSVRTS